MMMNVTYTKDSGNFEYSKTKDYLIANSCNIGLDRYLDLSNNNCYLTRVTEFIIESEFDDDKKKIIYHSIYKIKYPTDLTIDFKPVCESKYEDILDIIQFQSDAWYITNRRKILYGI